MSRVRVSRSAHVIMPYHLALDQANEARLADAKVGTTGRGIGPTYGDRAWRLGLRMEDLLDRAVLTDRLTKLLPDKNVLLRSLGRDEFEVEPLVEQGLAWGARLRDHLDDTTWLVQGALARASTCCSKAPRAPCSTSTTAATRTSRARTRSPAGRARAAGSARSRWTRSSAS